MRLQDLKHHIETIIRKHGNLEVYALNSVNGVDDFTMAGYANPDLDERVVLVVPNYDRVRMAYEQTNKEGINDEAETEQGV